MTPSARADAPAATVETGGTDRAGAAGTPPAGSGAARTRRDRRAWLGVLAVVALVAFTWRLVPVLRGGGLFGLIGYDGGVYYAAGVGLAHGLVPYVDYLLLHPPGIVLALAPFGLLGRLVGQPEAMVVANLVWMLLGTTTALLVAATLRRHGLLAALVGGLLYAVWVPAIFVERTTTLETVTGLLTLGAVWLLARPAPATLTQRAALVAGVLLGASCATKIWGVAPLLAIAVWCAFEHGLRRAAALALGAAAATVAICLPFFLGAPRTMWDMVVGAQLGRGRADVSWYTKAVDTAGLSKMPYAVLPLLVLVTVLVAVAVVLSVRSRVGRLATVLLVVGLVLLANSRAWSVDYASLAAAPVALLGGKATGVVAAAVPRFALLRLVPVLVLTGLVGYGVVSGLRTTLGEPFDGRAMARVVADTPGCVTTDDPAVLVVADVIDRNIERGCPLVVDLGGYSYYLQPGASLHVRRSRNPQWQQHVLAYLRSGTAAAVVRFDDNALSRRTRATVESWPALGTAGPYVIRRPIP